MDINIYSVNGSNSTPVAVIDSRELAQQYWLKYLTTATVFHRRLPMLSREGFKCLKIHGFSPVPGSTHINICHVILSMYRVSKKMSFLGKTAIKLKKK